MCIASISFVVGFIMVERTIEYAYPFALLFIFTTFPLLGIIYQESLESGEKNSKWRDLLTELYSSAIEKKKTLTKIIFLIFIFVFFAQTGSIIWILLKTPSYDTYKSSSQFIENHTAQGSIVYIPSFGMFTQTFFYNPTSRYTIGTDPVFTLLHDKSLYYEMEHLNSGETICDTPVCSKETIDPYTLLKNKIGASYILIDDSLFTDKKNNFETILRNDRRFVLVFQDTKFPNMKVFGFNQ